MLLRFGRREVGKSKKARNRIMIFPGPPRDDESTVREDTSVQQQLHNIFT